MKYKQTHFRWLSDSGRFTISHSVGCCISSSWRRNGMTCIESYRIFISIKQRSFHRKKIQSFHNQKTVLLICAEMSILVSKTKHHLPVIPTPPTWSSEESKQFSSSKQIGHPNFTTFLTLQGTDFTLLQTWFSLQFLSYRNDRQTDRHN